MADAPTMPIPGMLLSRLLASFERCKRNAQHGKASQADPRTDRSLRLIRLLEELRGLGHDTGYTLTGVTGTIGLAAALRRVRASVEGPDQMGAPQICRVEISFAQPPIPALGIQDEQPPDTSCATGICRGVPVQPPTNRPNRSRVGFQAGGHLCPHRLETLPTDPTMQVRKSHPWDVLVPKISNEPPAAPTSRISSFFNASLFV
jgi:hypothetical protein